MTFGGGPLNNATFQALAHMVPMLRAEPGTTGLLTFISGIITKHGTSLWSTTPPETGFAFADISDDVVASTRALDVVGDHRGGAVVDAYTVAYESGEPRYATVVARTADDVRIVARCDDAAVAAAMTGDEWCGREIVVDGDRFTPAG